MTDNVNTPYHYVAQIDDLKRAPDFQKDIFMFPKLNEDDSRRKPMSPSNDEKINDMEPISKIAVPADWNKDVSESGFGDVSKSVSFSPPDAVGSELSIYDRGYPIAKSEAEKFKAVLDKEPHVLDDNEIDGLSEQVLGTSVGDRSAFDLKHAETKVINGKKVLTVEGDWKEGGKKFYGMFVPKDENFRDIQEVFYEGTEPNFSKFRPEADKAISSIHWKN